MTRSLENIKGLGFSKGTTKFIMHRSLLEKLHYMSQNGVIDWLLCIK